MKQLWRHELEWVRKAPRARGTKSVDRIKKFGELEDTFHASKDILFQKSKKLTLEVQQRRM